MPTFKAALVWPIGPGGAVRSSQGQRVNVYEPGTSNVPAGLTQDGQAVAWVTSDEAGRAEFTTTSANVVDIASPDGSFSRRIESEENVGSGGGGGAVDSVNGQTGVVVLNATDVGAAATSHTHPAADLTASGTRDGTTYLRGDNTWAVPSRYVGVNAQVGTAYTPVLSDEGKLVTLNNAAAITVTLPQDSTLAFPVGGRVDFAGLGTGLATFVAGTGATVNGTPSLVQRARYGAMTAIKIAANTWLVVGDLA